VHKGSQMIKWGDGMDSQVGRERNQRTSVPKLSIIDACVCVCSFRCVSQCVHRCSVRCPPSKGPKEVQLENQQYRFLFIYKTQISRNLAYPQLRLYYRLAISPLCFYPQQAPARPSICSTCRVARGLPCPRASTSQRCMRAGAHAPSLHRAGLTPGRSSTASRARATTAGPTTGVLMRPS